MQDAASLLDAAFVDRTRTEAFLSQFAGTAAPLEKLDAVTGATVTSEAVLRGVNLILEAAAE